MADAQTRNDLQIQLKEAILDTCKRILASKSPLDMNCLLVVTRDADSHEVLLLNIKETLSPLSEETPLVDDPAGATGDQDGAKDSVQKEDAEMPQLSQQIIQKEVEIEPEELCEIEEAKEDIAHAESMTENIAPIKRERSPSLHQQKEEIKAVTTNRKRIYRPRSEHSCPVCSMVIHRKDNFQRHMKKHTGDMLKCHLCSKEFYSSGVLQEHVQVEHNNKRYLCNHCGKEFKYKQHFKSHIATHEGQFRFKCPDCDKMYNNKVSFEYHRCVHEDKREFACSKCAKTFITKGHLKVHENKCGLNSDSRKYCDYCYKKFLTTTSFQQHLGHCRNKPPTESLSLESRGTEMGDANENVEYQDIPTDTKVKLVTGDVATITVRQQIAGSGSPTKVDSLASSKIGQSLRKRSLQGDESVEEEESEQLPFPETGTSDILQAASEIANINMPDDDDDDLVESSELLNLALPPDDHGHDYTLATVPPSSTAS